MQASKNFLQKNILMPFASPVVGNTSIHSGVETSITTNKDKQETVQVSTTEQKILPWREWLTAFQRVFPIYLATHILFFLLTFLVNLFFLDNFSPQKLKGYTLLWNWNHWDTSQFTAIAQSGYDFSHAAFFPLYPVLEALLTPVFHRPFYAGLVISNLATLGLFMVLYQLVRHDGNEEQAARSVLYLAIFPTAFFLVAAYNESLFLLLAVSSFYCMRRGNWWLAGLCGGLASLTRSAGVLLLVPFCYEYLRQHEFSLKKMRLSVISGLLIPAGLAIFAIYCYYTLHDLLAFSHSQIYWGRHLSLPWDGFVNSYSVLQKNWGLTFDAIHNVIDFSAGIIMLVLLVLSFVGPWRFRRDQLAYALYAVATYLLLVLFPGTGEFPLESLSRLVMELFPLFIVLAAIGKRPGFNIHYLTISAGLLAFMLLQFLMGKWIV